MPPDNRRWGLKRIEKNCFISYNKISEIRIGIALAITIEYMCINHENRFKMRRK